MKKLLFCFIVIVALGLKTSAQTILTTVAGTGTTGYTGDGGPATAANIGDPYYVHYARNGNYYFVYNNVLRMVNPSGIIHTVAGGSTIGYSGDGGPASAAVLNFPYCVTSDTTGNLYISDNNNRVIRQINTAGTITTIAGNGIVGYSGDGGPASLASLSGCTGIVADKHGNLYFADNGNHRIRKIDAAGIITTVAGNGTSGFSGDGGPATTAQLNNPFDVDIDTSGNLFIVDGNNYRIRKVNASGIITTVAGQTFGGYSGDGGPATLAKLMPVGITVDKTGNLYIADNYNNRVRMVNTAGIITTIAGTGAPGFSDNCFDPTLGQLKWVRKVALDTSGNIYIADNGNYRIRKISRNVVPVIPAGPSQSLHLCKDAPAYSIDSWLGAIDSNRDQLLNWAVLTAPAHGTYAGAYSTAASSGLTTPSGLYYAPNAGYQGTDTFRLTVTDCSNKADTLSIIIYVYDTAIGAGNITGVDTVCQGKSITLSDAVPGGVWNATNSNATVIGGIVTGVTPGTVTIRYIVSNSCLSDTATRVVSVKACPNGIATTSISSETLKIWPNPNDGSFNITVFSAIDEEVTFTISNVVGERVSTFSANTNKALPLKLNLPAGLYLVNAQTATGVWSAKINVSK